jgi:hypothetical protein
VGLEIKHRQLVRQVGMFIEHPPENSVASFNFTSTMLDEGTTVIFDSWARIANGSGGFSNHLANPKKPKGQQHCRMHQAHVSRSPSA